MRLTRRNATASAQPYVVPTTQRFDGNDGKWSTFQINVGNPGQNFRALISTSSSTSWVPLADGCSSDDPENCPDLRGVELFGGANSRGYDATRSSASKLIGIYKMELGSTNLNTSYGSLYSNHSGMYYYDRIGLAPASPASLMLSPEVVAGVVDKAFFLSGFGLAINPNNFGSGALPTFLSLLPNSTTPIPSLSYGYTAGASYRNSHGSLVLGGYDQSRFQPPATSFSMAPGNTNALRIAVQSITVDTSDNSYSATLDSNNYATTFSASIDSTFPYLWLPRTVCDRLERILGLTYDQSTQLYTVNETSRQQNLNSTLNFKLADSQTSNIYSMIKLPYSAFDLNASWPIYPNSTRYFPIRRGPSSIFTLGRTFLQETYLTVDYERQNFSLAQATLGNGMEHIIPINKVRNSNPGLNPGTIFGIVIGAVLLLVITGIIVFCLLRKRKRRDRISLRSEPPETSEVARRGHSAWPQHALSNNNSNEINETYETHESSGSNSQRDTTPAVFSPTFSPTSSRQHGWPLPNNMTLPIFGAQQRHRSNISELPSTENSSGRSSHIRESIHELQSPADPEKPRLEQVSEMSCDTEIYELESRRVSSAQMFADRYRDLLRPPDEGYRSASNSSKS